MGEQARVNSIEAIENFRNRLVLFRDRATRVLDEVSDHLVRTRNWLVYDCPALHLQELRRLRRRLEQTEQELFSARLSPFQEATRLQEAEVRRLRQAVEEMEARLRRIRGWQQQYETKVQPMARHVETLRQDLARDMTRALAWLNQVLGSLSAYAELQPTHAPTNASSSASDPAGLQTPSTPSTSSPS
ncbi:MAG: hypothetical protein RMN51_06615 [Verrucomicrobiota bacterium]|nr:hypothetical protein [Limisphaera sp.]MDW8381763.1 hypothetical protein [Verrucomicrobiota bacterium]